MTQKTRYTFRLVFIIASTVSISWLGNSQELDRSLLENANAVILLESCTVDLEGHDKVSQMFYRKVKILNKKAEDLQNIYLYYKKGSDKIDDIKITIFDKDGNKVKSIKEKDLEDYASSDGFSMVTDYRVKHWKYNSYSYPLTIEYSYTKKSKTTLALPTWSPIPDYNIAVVKSTYNLNTTAGLRIKDLNLEGYNSISRSGNSYKMVNQPALNKEKYSNPDIQIFPAVVFNPMRFSFEGIDGAFDSWGGYGDWIYQSFLKDKKLENVESIKMELSKFISSSDSDLQIAQKIYDYVQENTRYVSIALDEGGLEPMNPNKVHEVKYGDCKALSLYMHTLLGLYGIESNYVEVHADSDYPIGLYEDFASSFPGNHIILQLMVDDDTTWVDCTSSQNPFGYLGKFTDDRAVLCINESGGKLTRTPALSKEENADNEKIRLIIDRSGNGIATVEHSSHGYNISRDLWLRDISPQKQEKYLKEEVYENMNMSKCSGFGVEVDETVPLSTLKYDLEIPRYAEIAGDYLFLSNHLSPLEIPKLPKDGKRENDIYFPRAYSQRSVLEIELPGEFELIKVATVELTGPYGSYSKELIMQDGKVLVKRSFELNKNAYSKENYKEIKSFFDRCIKSDRKQTTIKKLW